MEDAGEGQTAEEREEAEEEEAGVCHATPFLSWSLAYYSIQQQTVGRAAWSEV